MQSKTGSQVVLRTGVYSAALEGGFFVRIDSITADSRCPTNVVCVQAGSATVRLGLHAGTAPDSYYTVNTGSTPSAVAHGYRITLDSLRPYPAGQPILQADYRAYVTVTFLPDA